MPCHNNGSLGTQNWIAPLSVAQAIGNGSELEQTAVFGAVVRHPLYDVIACKNQYGSVVRNVEIPLNDSHFTIFLLVKIGRGRES